MLVEDYFYLAESPHCIVRQDEDLPPGIGGEIWGSREGLARWEPGMTIVLVNARLRAYLAEETKSVI